MQKRPIKILTLRKLPDAVADAVQRRAADLHSSFSKALISLLEERIQGSKRKELHHDLDHLFGTWSEKDALVFEQDLKNQRRIDPDLWK